MVVAEDSAVPPMTFGREWSVGVCKTQGVRKTQGARKTQGVCKTPLRGVMLLADAEMGEDGLKEVVGGGFAGDLAEGVHGEPDVGGGAVRG